MRSDSHLKGKGPNIRYRYLKVVGRIIPKYSDYPITTSTVYYSLLGSIRDGTHTGMYTTILTIQEFQIAFCFGSICPELFYKHFTFMLRDRSLHVTVSLSYRAKRQKHTTGGIPRWSPTLVLVARFSAYVWQSGRDAQFSLTYGRMCYVSGINGYIVLD